MAADIVVETGPAEAGASVGRAATVLLELVGLPDADLVVVLVDDRRIGELNRDYRGKDRPTDVLSFPQSDDPVAHAGVLATDAAAPVSPATVSDPPDLSDQGEAGILLGDVVISMDTAGRQAAAGGWDLDSELSRLVLHGFLHLLGYDHENDAAEAVRMQEVEEKLAGELSARGIRCASMLRAANDA